MGEYLSIENVSKSFPVQGGKPGEQIWVFRDVSLALRRGEFLSMVGHSGCGKSTLLNIVAGFDRASSGGVILDGSEITGPGLDRMVVFQSFALMPWLTAFENVRLAVVAARPGATRGEVTD